MLQQLIIGAFMSNAERVLFSDLIETSDRCFVRLIAKKLFFDFFRTGVSYNFGDWQGCQGADRCVGCDWNRIHLIVVIKIMMSGN